MKSPLALLRDLPADFRRVLLATLFFGAVSGIISSTFNNYLSDVHGFDASSRGWLELPREAPGFVIFGVVALLLLRLRESRIAALAMIATMAGSLGLGWLAPGPALLVVWTIVWSLGDHIIFAVEGPLGLKLAQSRQGFVDHLIQRAIFDIVALDYVNVIKTEAG